MPVGTRIEKTDSRAGEVIPWTIVRRQRTGRLADDFCMLQGTRPDGTAVEMIPMFTDENLANRFLASKFCNNRGEYTAFQPRRPDVLATLLAKLKEADDEALIVLDFELRQPVSVVPIGHFLETVRNLYPD